MKDFEKFYTEVEKVSVDVSILLNVLNLYYKIFLHCGNNGSIGSYGEFCDLLHIINQQSKEVNNEMQEILKKYM